MKPKPKFKVGQKVMLMDSSIGPDIRKENIKRVYFDRQPITSAFKDLEGWAYDVTGKDGRAWPEKLLRPLNKRERGDA